MKKQNLKMLLSFISLGLFLFLPVFAEMNYPMIAGITISEETTAAEYIIYFFNLCVGIGAFIAVVMVVLAGVDWMTAGDNSAKVSAAKGKIKNTLLGVAILMGCYLMLDAINPALKNIKIDNTTCTHGIKVTMKTETGKSKDICINDSTSKIELEILSTKTWYMDKDSIERVWVYPAENYGGKPVAVAYGGSINGAKSIFFEWTKQGAYLYNGTGFNLNSGVPFFVSSSIPNMVDYGFDNAANSIKFINPPNTVQADSVFNHAVVFEDPNYRGRCSFAGNSVTDLGSGAQGGNYPTPIGNNKLSSMIFYKNYGDPLKVGTGKIEFYSTSNCGGKKCEVIIGTNVTPQNIKPRDGGVCKESEWGDNEVMSFKITGSFGLVLMTNLIGSGDSGKCQYWGLKEVNRGTCFSKLTGEDVFSAVTCGIPGFSNIVCERPKSFMVFPIVDK